MSDEVEKFRPEDVVRQIVESIVGESVRLRLLTRGPSHVEALYTLEKIFYSFHYAGQGEYIAASLGHSRPVQLKNAIEAIKLNRALCCNALASLMQLYYYTS